MTEARNHVQRFLGAVRAILSARYPSHEVSEPIRHGTAYRFILTKPPESRILAVTDTLIAVGPTLHDDVQSMLLERHVFAVIDTASNEDVVYLTADGVEARPE